MLRSTLEQSCLYLTAELLAVDSNQAKAKSSDLFAGDLKRFPPVEDVVSILDRVASRAFAA